MLVFALILVASGVLVIVVSELTARGRIGINSIAGIRFGALLESDEAWTAGHRAARIPMDVAGLAIVVAGIWCAVMPVSDAQAGAIVLASMGVVLVMLIIAMLLAHRAATAALYNAAPMND